MPNVTPGFRGGAPGINPGLPGWRPPTPPPPRYRPEAVIRDFRHSIQTRPPAETFGRLQHESMRVLSAPQRLALAREAVQRLAIQVESGGNAGRNLADVRAARGTPGLEPEVRTHLDTLGKVAERRLLVEGITEVRGPAERGRWGEVATKTRSWLKEFRDNPAHAHLESAEFRAARVEVREALQEVAGVAERLDALDRLQGGATALEANRPAEASHGLGALERTNLPPALRRRYDGLRGVAELRELATRRWNEPPSAASVKASLARMERGLTDRPGFDAVLGKKVLQEMAFKALVEGHPELSKTLLPQGGPVEHAANLLRDLKALALGAGKVETGAGRAAVPEPGQGPSSPRGPPAGLEPLIPEAARAGWRPPVKESARADLPPLEKAAQLGQALGERLAADAKPARTALETKADAARARLNTVSNRVLAPERAERRQFAEVEAVLDRRLNPAERVQARALLAQKRPPAQVATTLQQQTGVPDEDEEFARECARRLGKPALGPDERGQALRLKKQGRTVAEVVAILRP
jgi:hypothetical protein